MNQKKSDNSYLRLMLALFGAAALSILLFFVVFRFDGLRRGVNTLIGVLMPFIVGAVLAYLLKPTCNAIEEKLTDVFGRQPDADKTATEAESTASVNKASDQNTIETESAAGYPSRSALANTARVSKLIPGLSILITMVLGILVICVLLIMVLPTLLESIYTIVRLIPSSIEAASDWLLQYAGDNETLSNYITEFSSSFSTSIPDWIRSTVIPNIEVLIGNVSNSVNSIFTFFKNVLIGMIAAIYILGSRKKFAAQAKLINYSIFGRKWSERILSEVRYADKVFVGFISGRLIDSLIIGIICFIGMLILRMPYAMLVSVIVGVTNIIPFFGPYIGAIPSFLLILMDSPVKAVIFLVFLLILQQFDGNILGPRILGNVTGLSGFWVLFAILTFGGLFGFIGMIVGVPVFAVIYDVVRKVVLHVAAQRRMKEGCQP
ncbi:MAG: AI-2E family transporter [Lachnospiraceae bacterium]|nr:AI-2E family transporter [Lachnospiraceae bacterium]